MVGTYRRIHSPSPRSAAFLIQTHFVLNFICFAHDLLPAHVSAFKNA
jgi:hypothetical protein